MKKQTTVEWLVEQYKKSFTLPINDVMTTIIEQAKEMEKGQMFEFWKGGIRCTEQGGKSFDQYYNETYQNQKP